MLVFEQQQKQHAMNKCCWNAEGQRLKQSVERVGISFRRYGRDEIIRKVIQLLADSESRLRLKKRTQTQDGHATTTTIEL